MPPFGVDDIGLPSLLPVSVPFSLDIYLKSILYYDSFIHTPTRREWTGPGLAKVYVRL